MPRVVVDDDDGYELGQQTAPLYRVLTKRWPEYLAHACLLLVSYEALTEMARIKKILRGIAGSRDREVRSF